MTKQRGFRFGVASLLFIVGVAALVLASLRYGPFLNEARFANWSCERTWSIHNFPCPDEVILTYTAHPWTGWRRSDPSTASFFTGICPEGPISTTPVNYESGVWAGQDSSRLFRRMFYPSHLVKESQIEWEPAWGHPEDVLFQFCKDRTVARWTAETFREWMARRAGEKN